MSSKRLMFKQGLISQGLVSPTEWVVLDLLPRNIDSIVNIYIAKRDPKDKRTCVYSRSAAKHVISQYNMYMYFISDFEVEQQNFWKQFQNL
jgi:hypothetical protein